MILKLGKFEFQLITQIPTDNKPLQVDVSNPGRIETILSRIIRDTALVRNIKSENHYLCQVCGTTIKLPNGKGYAEGHHLRPLGGAHLGPDIRQNIIILCPTHHTEFDYGSIAIEPHSLLIKHIDPNNHFHNKKSAYNRGDLVTSYLSYHYENIFEK
ncbi:HNH endonuclease [Oceanobacillus rekensis]|uniref:HNH endonuclease n=1 Tax=Oceanobacillus rekensis TaxID=937927 RepID=UPI000B442672|nr:HNH endonuclease [Oceanobacillus rekensis]